MTKQIFKSTILFFSFALYSIGCNNDRNAAIQLADSIRNADSINNAAAQKTSSIKEGSICTVENGDGGFGVVKVLVIEGDAIHVKIYKNKFKTRPATVNIADLSLGSITDTDGFGIGHVPLQRVGFDKWNPVVVGFEKVADEELEGYKMWKEQN